MRAPLSYADGCLTDEVKLPVSIGELVGGKYRVDRVIGIGGMGAVFAAIHEGLGQRVALKFLLENAAGQEALVERFRREARAAVSIHSEHVARVYDVGAHNGLPYLVMEYLEGEDLGQLLERRGPLPVIEVVDYLLQTCEAVAEAHAAKIVHRDLKPANLFLANRKNNPPMVKVLDFGISKLPTAVDMNLTKTSTLLGTPHYMAPEQMVDAKTADARSDVFSLGLILFELLTKRHAFEAESMPELIARTLQVPHLPVRELRPDVPEGVARAIDRCLGKTVDERFANVAELAFALAPYGPPDAEASARRAAKTLGAETAVAAPLPEPSVETAGKLAEAPPKAGNSRVLRIIAAVSFVAILAIFGAVAAKSRRVDAPPTTGEPAPPSGSAFAPTPSMTASATTMASAEGHPASSAPSSSSAITPPPSPITAKSSNHPSARPSASSAASASAPAPSSSCRAVPFLDENGVKRFRIECAR